MTQQQHSKSQLRSDHAMHELDKAERNFHYGATGVFIRANLALIYMYLIVASYSMWGIVGPIFISILALVSYFIPGIYRLWTDSLDLCHRDRRVPNVESGTNEYSSDYYDDTLPEKSGQTPKGE